MSPLRSKLNSSLLLLIASFALLAVFNTSAALAQPSIGPIQAITTFVDWEDQDSSRPTGTAYYTVRAKECAANTKLVFTLTINAPDQGYPIEVWAGRSGTDCGDVNVRSDTTKRCNQLLSLSNSQTQLELELGSQTLAAVLGADNGETVVGNAESCSIAQDASFTLYFFHTSGSDTVGTAQTFNISVNLLGPVPPSGLSAIGLDNRVDVSWTTTPSTGLVGYRVYCQPVAGDDCSSLSTASASDLEQTDAQATSATTADAGGVDAGSASATDDVVSDAKLCLDADGRTASCVLADSAPPSSLECGSQGNLAQGIIATNLENGQPYLLGVASVDSSGNVGKLSTLVCATPEHITDFWEAYKAAGGKGGGGFCEIVNGIGNQAPAHWAGWIIVLAAAAAFGTRRRN